jgi:hypothetical protein
VEGAIEWIHQYQEQKYTAYYVNFMFHPLKGSPDIVWKRMRNAMEGSFYSRFCTRFARNPKRLAERNKLPLFWLLSDLPVLKNKKPKIWDAYINDGQHFNGFMLIPPKSRFRGDVIEYFRSNQAYYARWPIQRIDVRGIYDVPNISDYAHKTISWGRASWEDALILPRSVSEVRKQVPMLPPELRREKDIMAAFNVSEDVAAKLAAGECRK